MPTTFQHFVTRSGDRLLDGDTPYRFISFNVPNLNYIEDNMEFDESNPYALPDEFEIRDCFATIKEMGGQCLRIYTIPARNKNFPSNAPTYVEAPGVFNEEAFKVTDLMLSLANEYGVRVIFSLLNNMQWMGGRPDYAAFRGKTAAEFWTDRQLIEDFKQTLDFTINRVNTITGVAYKDDKSILCWETGNELTSPVDWTIEICRHIKSLDSNHLVMDGYFAIDDIYVREESIQEDSIDILSSHHYERDPRLMKENILKNLEIVAGRKPYTPGEFGFVSTTGMANVLDSIIGNPGICGGMTWSLRSHRSKGGFYWHSEPLGNGLYKAFHFPGFTSGNDYDETGLMTLFRNKAFEIQNKPVPPTQIPSAPTLLPVEEPHAIDWQGSVGASGYNVERAQSINGPWELIGHNISDAELPYFPIFHDQTAKIGESYYYRVFALNSAGASHPSNTVGPVKTTRHCFVDTMKNLGALYEGKQVTIAKGNDRTYKELPNRLSGDYGSEVTYLIPGKLDQFKVYSFEQTRFRHLILSGSSNGTDWTPIEAQLNQSENTESSYAYCRAKTYTVSGDTDFRYIKIFYQKEAQLGRIEIKCIPDSGNQS